MNNRFFITFLALFVLLFQVGRAQGLIEGRITAQDGDPLVFVHVGVVSSANPYGTTTNDKGAYRLRLRSTDSVTVRFSATGYASQQYRVALSSNEKLVLNCCLLPLTIQLEEVGVIDTKVANSSFTHIDLQRIENTVGPNDGVESLLKTLPDVSSNNEMSSQYSVRGGSFDENLVYINDVEIYRPLLIRSGQQEGLSIINPDLVDNLMFSPGGFDASYGFKMSSVLDIRYSQPVDFQGRISVSLLGGSASLQGLVGDKFSYSIGFRKHNNRYLFKSLDTDGNYTTSYTDLQSVLGYHVNANLDLSLLTIWSKNIYGLIPSSRSTVFGTIQEPLELNIYFEGQEVDDYNTLLNAFTLDWHPTEDFHLKWITSSQSNRERELYDVLSEYRLYELGVGFSGEVNRVDRGVGSFLEHARNYLDLDIYSSEIKTTIDAPLGSWGMGFKVQYETISDQVREWKWVDSAGYSLPVTHPTIGVDDTVPQNTLLQQILGANNHVATIRTSGYLQREINYTTRKSSVVKFLMGVRGQYYQNQFEIGESTPDDFSQFLVSPRLIVNYQPANHENLIFRGAAGVYQQPSLYREMRLVDGSLNTQLPAQCSYQGMGTVDWTLTLWNKPFRITADAYYKYITNLVPYIIDNMRLRYMSDYAAVGYAAGVSVRINGEFTPGLESWASISLMQTQEDIIGDQLGWHPRPTDQRLAVKLFLQDYIPSIPWWRTSLNFIYGSRAPYNIPGSVPQDDNYRLPSYFRVDWGNTIQLSRFSKVQNSALMRYFDDILVGIEVFNLFNYRNVVSYIWVSDYTNHPYPVPNYLTARQINVKLTATF